uniref:Filamin/ABP280 repeat protein n=1 Tax=Meloidogyne javanica TaxID=6303 RepID=A0A915LRA5_MELJA
MRVCSFIVYFVAINGSDRTELGRLSKVICHVNTRTTSIIGGEIEAINSGNIQIYVTSPQGLKRNCEVIHRGNAFTTTFTPERIGKWLIGILYEGAHIEGSPFSCFVFDPDLVHVSGLDVGLVFSSINGRPIDTVIKEEPPNSNVYRAKLEPQGPGKYKIQIDFNNRDVKGSPFILDIAGTEDGNGGISSVYGDQLQMAAVGRLATFFVHAPGIEFGVKRHARISPFDGQTFKVEWNPNETGEHLIDVFLFDRQIPESPFSCQVGDPELVSVRRMPQQIEGKNLNKPHTFEIDATAAGSGNLEIVINNGRVACRVHETTSRHFIAEFTPTQEIRHFVEMRFNGEHVRDSPWSIPFIESSPSTITRSEQPLISPQLKTNEKEDIAIVGELAHFDVRSNIRLRTTNVAVRIVDIESGRPIENLFLTERGPGTVRCEYTLMKAGDYEVSVYIDDRLVDVDQLIISAFDPRQVHVKLRGNEEDYIPDKPVHFIV